MNPSTLIPATSPLRKLASLPRFTRDKICVLVVRNDYHVQAECIRALRQLGHRVIELRLGIHGGAVPPEENIEKVLQAAVRHRPDLLLSINYTGFDRVAWMSEALEAIGLPTAVWVVDSPLFMAQGLLSLAAARMALFCWDRSYVPEMKRLGYSHVFHLPLATCSQAFVGVQTVSAKRFDKSFVGHSLVILEDRWRKRLTPEDRALGEQWAQTLLASRPALHTLVPDPHAPIDRRALVLAFANMVASKLYRRRQLEEVADKKLHLFGDKHWQELLPSAQCHGPVAYGEELAKVFVDTSVNINATNLQMPETVNQRVFDVPQAGGFLLTDHQAELPDYFDLKREMATYQTPEELAEKTEFYLKHESERTSMVLRAQRRISAEHTYVHRMKCLVQTMKSQVL